MPLMTSPHCSIQQFHPVMTHWLLSCLKGSDSVKEAQQWWLVHSSVLKVKEFAHLGEPIGILPIFFPPPAEEIGMGISCPLLFFITCFYFSLSGKQADLCSWALPQDIFSEKPVCITGYYYCVTMPARKCSRWQTTCCCLCQKENISVWKLLYSLGWGYPERKKYACEWPWDSWVLLPALTLRSLGKGILDCILI